MKAKAAMELIYGQEVVLELVEVRAPEAEAEAEANEKGSVLELRSFLQMDGGEEPAAQAPAVQAPNNLPVFGFRFTVTTTALPKPPQETEVPEAAAEEKKAKEETERIAKIKDEAARQKAQEAETARKVQADADVAAKKAKAAKEHEEKVRAFTEAKNKRQAEREKKHAELIDDGLVVMPANDLTEE